MKDYSVSLGRKSPPALSFRGTLKFTSTATLDERPPLQGTFQEVIADLQEYSEAGVSHVIMEIAGDTYDDIYGDMEQFVEKIKPTLP